MKIPGKAEVRAHYTARLLAFQATSPQVSKYTDNFWVLRHKFIPTEIRDWDILGEGGADTYRVDHDCLVRCSDVLYRLWNRQFILSFSAYVVQHVLERAPIYEQRRIVELLERNY